MLETVEKAHGRLEIRRYRSPEVAAEYIREELQFPGVRQVLRIERQRTELSPGKKSSEQVHAISSLDPVRADLKQMAQYVRGHWGIENKLHYVRDGRNTFDEDHQTVRGSAAQVMAILRNLAISCLRLARAPSIASALRWVAGSPLRALALIGV